MGWAFLLVANDLKDAVYDDLPDALGFDGAPVWWPLPVLAVAGAVTAFAITRLPGTGGHVPANGLSAGATTPIELPGVVLAALASIGLGAVVGPEAPLIAIGVVAPAERPFAGTGGHVPGRRMIANLSLIHI